MSRWWSHLAGDTDVFAVELFFSADPSPSAEPTENASWGGMRLWAGGRNLCAHEEDGVRLDAVHWYLLPLLEWLAEVWDPLLHEERFPYAVAAGTAVAGSSRGDDPPANLSDEDFDRWMGAWQRWWQRHGIQAARRGGLFPNVLLRRYRDRIEISWGPTRLPGLPDHVRFEATSGVVRLVPGAVASPLHAVLANAATALRDRMPDCPRVAALASHVDALHDLGRTRGRLAWLAASERPSDAGPGWIEILEGSPDSPGGDRSYLDVSASPLVVESASAAVLLASSLPPQVSPGLAGSLGRALRRASRPVSSSLLDDLSRSTPLGDLDADPTREGILLAERVGEALVKDGDATDLDRLLAELGVESSCFDDGDPAIHAVSFCGPGLRPTVLLAPELSRLPHRRRATLAHELCHLLFDREPDRFAAIASGPWAPRDLERRANAFAAMLLMPRDVVERRIRSLPVDLATAQGVVRLAMALGNSVSTVLEHVTELGFLDEADKERIRLDLDESLSTSSLHAV